MTIAPVLKAYSNLYMSIYHKNYWRSPKIIKQFNELQKILDENDIDANTYVIFSNTVWAGTTEHPIIQVNILCSDKAVQRYLNTNPATDLEYVYAVIAHIENSRAIYTLKYYLYNYAEDTKIFDMWVEDELSVIAKGISWKELIEKHPSLYRKAVSEAMQYLRTVYGLTGIYGDYVEAAKEFVVRIRNGQ